MVSYIAHKALVRIMRVYVLFDWVEEAREVGQ